MTMCYCGGHYRCEKCRHDVCYCICDVDGAPHTQAEVTAGYVHPSQAHLEAWNLNQELSR